MCEVNSSLCDKCLLNPYCCNVGGVESCHALCTSEDDPAYKIFQMGYNAGYEECASEYEDEYDELREALDAEEWEDDEGEEVE